MNKETLGDFVIGKIIENGLVYAHSEGLCVWESNAAEFIEAAIAEYKNLNEPAAF